MRADPHDQMLLTRRPTTVITQGTAMLDRMPMPYGSQDDEESLFAGIGNDAGVPMNAAINTATQGQLVQNVPSVAPEQARQGTRLNVPPPTTQIQNNVKTVAMVGAGILVLSWLGFFKGR